MQGLAGETGCMGQTAVSVSEMLGFETPFNFTGVTAVILVRALGDYAPPKDYGITELFGMDIIECFGSQLVVSRPHEGQIVSLRCCLAGFM